MTEQIAEVASDASLEGFPLEFDRAQVPEYLLAANAADRYSVGDRTRGIVHDDDGGLTITMSTTRPTDPILAADRPPAPERESRPRTRLYAPGAAAFAGEYRLPAIERIG